MCTFSHVLGTGEIQGRDDRPALLHLLQRHRAVRPLCGRQPRQLRRLLDSLPDSAGRVPLAHHGRERAGPGTCIDRLYLMYR